MYLFCVEAKVDIKPYAREVYVIRLNQWLQQMEVYFNVHKITGKQNISFAQLNIEGRALAWWESDAVIRLLGNEPPMNNWEVFKDMIKSNFYPIGYEEHQQIVWHYFRQRQG
jgi:hypothetical protein